MNKGENENGFGASRSTTGRLMSVTNNLYHTKPGRYNVESVLYCLERMNEEMHIPKQQLIVMFLRQGMETHPDYAARCKEYMDYWNQLHPSLDSESE